MPTCSDEERPRSGVGLTTRSSPCQGMCRSMSARSVAEHHDGSTGRMRARPRGRGPAGAARRGRRGVSHRAASSSAIRRRPPGRGRRDGSYQSPFPDPTRQREVAATSASSRCEVAVKSRRRAGSMPEKPHGTAGQAARHAGQAAPHRRTSGRAQSLRMPTAQRARDRGRWRAQALMHDIAAELREARLTAGLSQEHVGRVAGLSQSKVSRIERAQRNSAGVDELAKHCAALGLRLSLKVYPEGEVGTRRRPASSAPSLPRGAGWRVQLAERGAGRGSRGLPGVGRGA